jgi:hypothetical protein
MGVTYMIPAEPVEIKRRAFEAAGSREWAFIRRDKVIKLYGLSAQALPKYLWAHWKSELKAKGLSWQLFLKAISACEYDVVRWVEGQLSWEELVGVIMRVLDKASKGVYPLWPP